MWSNPKEIDNNNSIINYIIVTNGNRFTFQFADWASKFDYQQHSSYCACADYVHKNCLVDMMKDMKVPYCPECRKKVNMFISLESLDLVNLKYINGVNEIELYKTTKITNVFELLQYFYEDTKEDNFVMSEEKLPEFDQFIGSIEGVEIGMRETTGLIESAYLYLEEDKLKITV